MVLGLVLHRLPAALALRPERTGVRQTAPPCALRSTTRWDFHVRVAESLA